MHSTRSAGSIAWLWRLRKFTQSKLANVFHEPPPLATMFRLQAFLHHITLCALSGPVSGCFRIISRLGICACLGLPTAPIQSKHHSFTYSIHLFDQLSRPHSPFILQRFTLNLFLVWVFFCLVRSRESA